MHNLSESGGFLLVALICGLITHACNKDADAGCAILFFGAITLFCLIFAVAVLFDPQEGSASESQQSVRQQATQANSWQLPTSGREHQRLSSTSN